MLSKQTLLALLLPLIAILATAQSIVPITRFHPSTGKYDFYDDRFLSGFMQSAPSPHSAEAFPDGFLQMPFVGDPLLIYVGEKDSTQFTAYASGFKMKAQGAQANQYRTMITRYGIQATVTAHPGYVEQTYVYPDTIADKGFLIDLDHALTGAPNEDMDVVFVDKQNIRAYKRSQTDAAGSPQLYYFAHFSHPFDTWNVRRERVSIENGQKEARCKVAFTFKLDRGEALTVLSAVSSQSTDAAYALLPKHDAARRFADTRHAAPKKQQPNLMAQASTSSTAPATSSRTKAHNQNQSTTTAPHKGTTARKQTVSAQANAEDALFEISTRDAQLRTAFCAALSQLRTRSELKRASTAADFLAKLSPLYPAESAPARAEGEAADTLLRHYASCTLQGIDCTADFGTSSNASIAQSAWIVFSALGLRPQPKTDVYTITHPAFNVATLHLQGGRRMVLYVRRADPRRRRVESVFLNGASLTAPYTLTQAQLTHGGMLEVKMTE